MKTFRKISHTPMVWVGLLILSLGLAVALKLTFKAQDISGNVQTPAWQDADIGAAPQSGSAQTNGGTYTLTSAGADIYGTNDSFQYVYQPLGTNGQLVARV